MPLATFPEWMAHSAPLAWEIDFSRLHPRVQEDWYEELVFAVLRVLVCPPDLAKLFMVTQNTLQTLNPPSTCIISVRQSQRRTVQRTLSLERPGRQPELTAQIRRLMKYKVLPELVGTRLQFLNGRWCVAPPVRPGGHRKECESRVQALEQRTDLNGVHEREHFQTAQTFKAVHLPVSRLLAFWHHSHPDQSGAAALATHCECSSNIRARCINWRHIGWASPATNSYQAVLHEESPDSAGNDHLPLRSRPLDWESPSKRGNVGQHHEKKYYRRSCRLAMTGSRQLDFELFK